MHEQSLVRCLLDQVDRIRRDNHSPRVAEVRVAIGPLSGVEYELLCTAFDQLAPLSAVAGARLVVDQVPLTARCRECQHDFEMSDFVFRCPACRGRVEVTGGHEVQLVSVSLTSATLNRCAG